MRADWVAWLDDLEAVAAEARTSLSPRLAPDPPGGLGPLPADLRARAEEVVVILAEAQAHLASQQTAVARRLADFSAQPLQRQRA
ncbi:MAG: hypothetical protein ACRD0J_02470 [Acidimicrobiales bacterium]